MKQTAALDESVVLTVNGAEREIAPGTTVSALLQSLSVDPRMVVVEHNREILRDHGEYAERVLQTGDVLEIVHFVGGG